MKCKFCLIRKSVEYTKLMPPIKLIPIYAEFVPSIMKYWTKVFIFEGNGISDEPKTLQRCHYESSGPSDCHRGSIFTPFKRVRKNFEVRKGLNNFARCKHFSGIGNHFIRWLPVMVTPIKATRVGIRAKYRQLNRILFVLHTTCLVCNLMFLAIIVWKWMVKVKTFLWCKLWWYFMIKNYFLRRFEEYVEIVLFRFFRLWNSILMQCFNKVIYILGWIIDKTVFEWNVSFNVISLVKKVQ